MNVLVAFVGVAAVSYAAFERRTSYILGSVASTDIVAGIFMETTFETNNRTVHQLGCSCITPKRDDKTLTNCDILDHTSGGLWEGTKLIFLPFP